MVRIVDFTDAQANENISFLTLDNRVSDPLPGTFVICGSHYLEKISNFGTFELYDNLGKPWMTLLFAFYPSKGATLLAWLFLEGRTKQNI